MKKLSVSLLFVFFFNYGLAQAVLAKPVCEMIFSDNANKNHLDQVFKTLAIDFVNIQINADKGEITESDQFALEKINSELDKIFKSNPTKYNKKTFAELTRKIFNSTKEVAKNKKNIDIEKEKQRKQKSKAEKNSVVFHPQEFFTIKPDKIAKFSPDSKLIATASEDGTVKITEVASGEKLFNFSHKNFIQILQFSPDGKYLVTQSARDNTVKIHDVNTHTEVFSQTYQKDVRSVHFSPDSQSIVITSSDRDSFFSNNSKYFDGVKIYDIATNTEIFSVSEDNTTNKAQLSPNGKHLFTIANNGQTKIYEVATKEKLFTISHGKWVRNAEFSPDGKYISSASEDGTAKVYEVATGKELFVITHKATIASAKFSPDSQYVVTTSTDGTAKVYEVATRKELFVITHTEIVYGAEFSPNSQYVVTASYDRSVKAYHISSKSEVFSINHATGAHNAKFSPDSKYIISRSHHYTEIHDLLTQDQVFSTEHTSAVYGAEFSPDGKYAFSAGSDEIVKLIKLYHTLDDGEPQ